MATVKVHLDTSPAIAKLAELQQKLREFNQQQTGTNANTAITQQTRQTEALSQSQEKLTKTTKDVSSAAVDLQREMASAASVGERANGIIERRIQVEKDLIQINQTANAGYIDSARRLAEERVARQDNSEAKKTEIRLLADLTTQRIREQNHVKDGERAIKEETKALKDADRAWQKYRDTRADAAKRQVAAREQGHEKAELDGLKQIERQKETMWADQDRQDKEELQAINQQTREEIQGYTEQQRWEEKLEADRRRAHVARLRREEQIEDKFDKQLAIQQRLIDVRRRQLSGDITPQQAAGQLAQMRLGDEGYNDRQQLALGAATAKAEELAKRLRDVAQAEREKIAAQKRAENQQEALNKSIEEQIISLEAERRALESVERGEKSLERAREDQEEQMLRLRGVREKDIQQLKETRREIRRMTEAQREQTRVQKAAKAAEGQSSIIGTAVRTARFAAIGLPIIAGFRAIQNVAQEVVQLYTGAVTQAIQFSAEVERNSVSIGIMIDQLRQRTSGEGFDFARYQDSLEQAEEVQRRILIQAAQLPGTAEDHLAQAQAVLAYSQDQLGTLEDRVKVTGMLAALNSILNQHGEKAVTEVRQLFNLETERGQVLLRILGVSIEEARVMRDKGQWLPYIVSRQHDIGEQLKSMRGTWTQLTDSAQTFTNILLREEFKGIFEDWGTILEGAVQELLNVEAAAIRTGKSEEELLEIGRRLADWVQEAIRDFAGLTANLTNFVAWLERAADTARLIPGINMGVAAWDYWTRAPNNRPDRPPEADQLQPNLSQITGALPRNRQRLLEMRGGEPSVALGQLGALGAAVDEEALKKIKEANEQLALKNQLLRESIALGRSETEHRIETERAITAQAEGMGEVADQQAELQRENAKLNEQYKDRLATLNEIHDAHVAAFEAFKQQRDAAIQETTDLQLQVRVAREVVAARLSEAEAADLLKRRRQEQLGIDEKIIRQNQDAMRALREQDRVATEQRTTAELERQNAVLADSVALRRSEGEHAQAALAAQMQAAGASEGEVQRRLELMNANQQLVRQHEQIKNSVIDISGAWKDVFKGITSGTSDLNDVFARLGDNLLGQFADAFLFSKVQKFDIPIKNNIFDLFGASGVIGSFMKSAGAGLSSTFGSAAAQAITRTSTPQQTGGFANVPFQYAMPSNFQASSVQWQPMQRTSTPQQTGGFANVPFQYTMPSNFQASSVPWQAITGTSIPQQTGGFANVPFQYTMPSNFQASSVQWQPMQSSAPPSSGFGGIDFGGLSGIGGGLLGGMLGNRAFGPIGGIAGGFAGKALGAGAHSLLTGGSFGAGATGALPMLGAAAGPAALLVGGVLLGKTIFDAFNKPTRIELDKKAIRRFYDDAELGIPNPGRSETRERYGEANVAFAEVDPALHAISLSYVDLDDKIEHVFGTMKRFGNNMQVGLLQMGASTDVAKDKVQDLSRKMDFDLMSSLQNLKKFQEETNWKEYNEEIEERINRPQPEGRDEVLYVGNMLEGMIQIQTGFHRMIDSAASARRYLKDAFIDAAASVGVAEDALDSYLTELDSGEQIENVLQRFNREQGVSLQISSIDLDEEQIVREVTGALERVELAGGIFGDALKQGISEGQSMEQAGMIASAAFSKGLQDGLRDIALDKWLEDNLEPVFQGIDWTQPLESQRDAWDAVLDKVGGATESAYEYLDALGLLPAAVERVAESIDELLLPSALEERDFSRRTAIDAHHSRRLAVGSNIPGQSQRFSPELQAWNVLMARDEQINRQLDILEQAATREADRGEDASPEFLNAVRYEQISILDSEAEGVVTYFREIERIIGARLQEDIAAVNATFQADIARVNAEFEEAMSVITDRTAALQDELEGVNRALDARLDALREEKDLAQETLQAKQEELRQLEEIQQQAYRLAEAFESAGDSIDNMIGQIATQNPLLLFGERMGFLERQEASLRSRLDTAPTEDRPGILTDLSQVISSQLSLQQDDLVGEAGRDMVLETLKELQALRDIAGEQESQQREIGDDTTAGIESLNTEIISLQDRIQAIGDEEQAAQEHARVQREALQAAIEDARAQREALQARAEEQRAALQARAEEQRAALQARATADLDTARMHTVNALDRVHQEQMALYEKINTDYDTKVVAEVHGTVEVTNWPEGLGGVDDTAESRADTTESRADSNGGDTTKSESTVQDFVDHLRAEGFMATVKPGIDPDSLISSHAAAAGMDEMVYKPTRILAGEAGPEHVRITPRPNLPSPISQSGSAPPSLAMSLRIDKIVVPEGTKDPKAYARALFSETERLMIHSAESGKFRGVLDRRG